MVVLEIDRSERPINLEHIFVAGANGGYRLSAIVHYTRELSPLAVFHSQSFPSTTVSFIFLPDVPLSSRRQTSSARGGTAHARRHPRQFRRQRRRFQ
jgi:multidrug efflux pump subunit AcrB